MGAEADRRGLKRLLTRHRALLVIVLIALAARVAFFVAFAPWDGEVVDGLVLRADAVGYHELALGILKTKSFESFQGMRTPGYPVFAAGAYLLFGARPWAVLLLQVFVGTLTVVLVHRWARLAVGARAALIAAALYAIEPHAILNTVRLLTDTLFVPLFLGAAIALVHGLREKRVTAFLASGLLLGLATLTRPIGQYFPVVAIVLILSNRRPTWRFRARAAAALVVAFVLTISPWLLRNQAAYGHASLSSMRGDNLLNWQVVSMVVSKTGRSVDDVRTELMEEARGLGYRQGENPFDNDRILEGMAKRYIRADLSGYARQHLKGVVNMFMSFETQMISDFLGLPSTPMPFQTWAGPDRATMVRTFLSRKSPHELAIAALIGLFLLITYLSALAGAAISWRERRLACLFIAVAVVVYFSAMVGAIGAPRYKMPIAPFYLALSGRGLLGAWRAVSRRRRSPGGRRSLSLRGDSSASP